MVSCASPLYRADIVRLIHGDPHPQGPGRKEEQIDTSINGDYPGRIQEIHPGSYVVLPAAPLLADLSSFTLQAWIYPTLPGRGWQGLLTRWDAQQASGYGLLIGPEGDIVARLGRGSGASQTFRTGVALQPHRWYFVAVVFDIAAGCLRLYQQAVVPWASAAAAVVVEEPAVQVAPGPASAPFLMAASWDGCRAVEHYEGKIEAPLVFPRALSPAEMDLLRRPRSPPGIFPWIYRRQRLRIRLRMGCTARPSIAPPGASPDATGAATKRTGSTPRPNTGPFTSTATTWRMPAGKPTLN